MADPIIIITPYLLLFFAIISFFGNGIILLTVWKNSSLRHKDCLYLIASLAAFDFLTAIGTLPYAANMIIHGNRNCTTGSILLSIAGHIVGYRANQLMTFCLGLDRVYAACLPLNYCTKKHLNIARVLSLICFFFGCADAAMLLIGPDFNRIMPTCVAVISATPQFRFYKMVCDLGINIGILLTYVVIIIKIHFMKSQYAAQREDGLDYFKQVTNTIAFILLFAIILTTIPSFLNIFDIITGFGLFQRVGPLLGITNTLNGAVNIFIYALKHRDFKSAVINLLWKQKRNSINVALIGHVGNTQSI